MIKWGIVGAGNIAHSFSKDLALVNGGKLVSVASRNLEKAKTFADEYGAPNAFGSYDELFNSNTVDVIYIATPHTNHAQLSIAAMKAGNNVLCEKPAGVNKSEVAQMVKVAKENQVFFMEALWSRFNPTIIKVKELVDNGTIGNIGYLHADFAFYGLDRNENGRLLNPELAGGSLLDIGIYPIFLSYLMLGKPKDIKATANFYKTGVEVQMSIIFNYENAQAILYSGLNSNSEKKAEIAGSKGTIFIHPRWHEASGYTIEKGDDTRINQLVKIGKGYTYEIEEVHSCLRSGKKESELWSHQNSLDLIEIMDSIRKKTGIVFPFE
ncbi:Gfo/Idh/MocA family protein [Maribacter hydrothermalis]|uniref:Oxidoreductase n=1 Tax=Maribacter hydrothermalis TaxID=1836467 RepID=A0A1B7ZCS7_9FLAO|nr:Gfo/Idh/MocA family oxidoreductase [Maribacter hydrothermalis]APQ18554.1 oxidoreductase [Maribacter hydrothermalis]OBR40891.1 oxidoreductase [Maribacter hydrothermalis]